MGLHHTKTKGDLGVLKAQVDLFEQGFTVCLPLTEHAPFDLMAYKDGEFRRVQVKYRALNKQGALEVKFSTCWADRNGTHIVPIDKEEVDLYCIYCPDTDQCYYIEPGDFGSNVSLRVETPKNGQAKRVNYAADFRRVP
jgi:hypothetical protein